MISTDSFGSVREVLKGWTPETKGVFTEDLDRARKQLAATFINKSESISPTAQGTDIFGGLWHMKALLESSGSRSIRRDIWILSDMMNETAEFNMPALVPLGPEKMLEESKGKHLLVPLTGYRIHVLGATPSGMSPPVWNSIKEFWTAYFAAAGAELVTYSVEASANPRE